MAKPPRMSASKVKPMQATLNRAERMQKLEAAESRLARATPPKNKPATPTMSPAARAATQATLSRAERVQAEEARGDALLMRRRPAAKDVISVVTRMRETPAKKGR